MISIRAYLHYAITALLLLACKPALWKSHLSLSINWHRLVPLYWVSFGLRSLFAASLLAVVGLNPELTLIPVWKHFVDQKVRLFIFVPFVIWALASYGFYYGLVWISTALVCTELHDRKRGNLAEIAQPLVRVLIPAAYFFLGLILIFVYNDVIAATRDVGFYDSLYSRTDSYLLGGGSVSQLVRYVGLSVSPSIFWGAEAIYYRMFDQVGGVIILIAMCVSAKHALRLVGTLLTAYYLALFIFLLWPSLGPFYTCADHFSHFPSWLKTYEIQRTIISNARILRSGQGQFVQINTDYYIAFPSLHIALPVIVLWFFRRWKRIRYCLLAFDVLLIPAILLLEWHYVVDLFGGILVALLAIFLNNDLERKNPAKHGASMESPGRDSTAFQSAT